MQFALHPIDHEWLPSVRRAAPYWNAYGGMWAVDSETTDCMFFIGRDVKDPTIPSEFCLLTQQRTQSWRFEVLECRHVPHKYLASLIAAGDELPDFLAVLRCNAPAIESTSAPYHIAKAAFQAFERKPRLDILFVPNWNSLFQYKKELLICALQQLEKERWERKTSAASYKVGRRLGQFLRRLGLLK